MTFKQAVCLWVSPDFTAFQKGRGEAPRVNHSKVDFKRLKAALAAEFRFGPAVKLQVANDTIDQVTIHTRMARDPLDIRCEDFGKQLLKASKADAGEVLDVRKGWSTLHVLADRDFAPPPVGIPFLITATDFEDAQIWVASTRPALGLTPFNPFVESPGSDQDAGVLSKKLKAALESIFRVPFEDFALLNRIASDKLPAWVDDELKDAASPSRGRRGATAKAPEDPKGPRMSDVIQTAAEISRMQRMLNGQEDDGRVFNLDEDEIRSGMEQFIEMATGESIDADEFMNQVRLAGGIHGPSAPSWFDLLSTLGWNIEDWDEKATRFQPSFVVVDQSGRTRIPVVCENYPYAPGDDGDNLVTAAKKALSELYPAGAMLTFKTIFSMEANGRTFSCGGLYYTKKQWRPFALSRHTNGLDALLHQQEEGFSFNAPDPRYADDGCAVAVGLNLMTHGKDPNDHDQPMIRLASGTWFSVLPDSL